ncbi:hypothetical protein FLO80_16640 [Aquicoccus porphyridii]|uniref:GNAT family N-acetyltransferase n=1 Tax=Aquicoccus porphyridii TaxID=1852029 RepID=A0A5A9Z5F5_9RHOB|nr:hypothetical protein [Aquicoccus porphyridii]KAA0912239.1 hypothetical protein FLO80_16640 [Aquicoccus porphyridii]RAI52912.1 hypothetical protein DOO74_15630 [Rhodobacteraceae bacterium AsT-22]
MREDEILQAVVPFYAEIERLGYSVRASTDFDEIQRLVPQTGREKQTPMMSISRNDFTADRAFWLFLFKGDEVVGGVAAKHDRLGDEGFGSYLRRTSREQYGRDRDPIAQIARPVEDLLQGNIVYIGELEFRNDHRGKLALLEALIKILQVICVMKWPGFDWMYAIIPENHLRIAYLYGFILTIPEAIQWVDPEPDGRLNSHVVLAVEGRHLNHVLKAAKSRADRARVK